MLSVARDRAHGLPSGRSGGKQPRPATAEADYFPSAGKPRLYIAKQNSPAPPPFTGASALRFAAGAGPVRPPPFVAAKAAMAAADPTKGSSK